MVPGFLFDGGPAVYPLTALLLTTRQSPRMRAHDFASGLPIAPLLPDVVTSLRSEPNLVLEAPPGAGKTTAVPLALLRDGGFADGIIMVLEPRRVAGL